MSERRIAEIIGYVRCDCDPDCESWTAPDGTEIVYFEPTPDDMLAWLRGRGCSIKFSLTPQYDVVLKVWPEMAAEPTAYFNVTLHAALEAAIRAVADH